MIEIFDNNLVIVFNTMVIPGIYWLGLESVLKSKIWFTRLKIVSLILILIGAIILLLSDWNRHDLGLAYSFLFPFYHLWFYKKSRNYFIKKEKREPVETAFNWKSGLGKDRAFALFFVIFSIFSSMLIYGIIAWNSNYTS